jgi:peptidylprolyl isomerase
VAKDTVVSGFVKGLVGQKVGSQVLLVIPPDEGYGAQGQGEVPANATIIFVVDILGISN